MQKLQNRFSFKISDQIKSNNSFLKMGFRPNPIQSMDEFNPWTTLVSLFYAVVAVLLPSRAAPLVLL